MAGYNTWGFTFSEILSFFLSSSSFCFAFFSYFAIFGIVETVKERSCAMASLNILIYNKIIKQAVKPAVQVQNMSGLNMLRFEVNYLCHV